MAHSFLVDEPAMAHDRERHGMLAQGLEDSLLF
jgi:hypothetical protein